MANNLCLGSDGQQRHVTRFDDGPTTCRPLSMPTVAASPFCSARSVAGSVGDDDNSTIWDHAGFFDSDPGGLSGQP